MKVNVLLLAIFLFTTCNGQSRKEKQYTAEQKEFLNFKNKNIMDKEFDLAFYEMVKGKRRFKLENGNIIAYISFDDKKGGTFREYLASPSFLLVQRKYYPNRKIKEKRFMLPGLMTKVGISEYYDEKGNKTTVDEDKKFGKIKPDYILRFLEKKGYINLKTGEGRFIDNMWDAFGITYSKHINLWSIGIVNGKPYDGPYDDGEPPAYSPIYFYIDGDSGELMPDGEFERREKSTYKVYNGKKYSYKEWKAFEEQEYKKYLENKKKKGF